MLSRIVGATLAVALQIVALERGTVLVTSPCKSSLVNIALETGTVLVTTRYEPFYPFQSCPQ